MTERGARHVQRDVTSFRVGPSGLHWNGQALHIDLDERASPLPRRVQGRVTLHPTATTTFVAPIDHAGRHRWQPIAPCARLEVSLREPALSWRGSGYFDANEGDESISRGFTRWDWMRTCERDATTVIYDVDPRGGLPKLIARRFARDGSHVAVDVTPRKPLAATPLWRIDRQVRALGMDTASGFAGRSVREPRVRVARTLEDTPFYARSLMSLHSGDDREPPIHAVHETLDADRLDSTVVQWMLPFRMPRRG
jgi:carotenoid 1,2-hydratase